MTKCCQLSVFEELANHFNFAHLQLKSNQAIWCFESHNSFCGNFGVMWPERVLYKLNKRTQEKKVILENKLQIFKAFDYF